MKTLNNMKEQIRDYLDPENTKVLVVGQRTNSFKRDQTIIEQVLRLNDACLIFGNYEMMSSAILSVYNEVGYPDLELPCIKCVINLNLVKEE